MILTLNPGQKIEIRFSGSASCADAPSSEEAVIVQYGDEDREVRVSVRGSDKLGRKGVVYGNAPDSSQQREESSLSDSEKRLLGEIRRILVDHLGCDPDLVKLDADLDMDLGADSLDKVELIMAFEAEYGVEIDDVVADGIMTVSDILNELQVRT
jgi:Acyl carrier protein